MVPVPEHKHAADLEKYFSDRKAAGKTAPLYLFGEAKKEAPKKADGTADKSVPRKNWIASGDKNWLLSPNPNEEYRGYVSQGVTVTSFEQFKEVTHALSGRQKVAEEDKEYVPRTIEGKLSWQLIKDKMLPLAVEELINKWKMFVTGGFVTNGVTQRVLDAKFPHFTADELADLVFYDMLSRLKYEEDVCMLKADGTPDDSDRCRKMEPHRSKFLGPNGDSDFIRAFGDWTKKFGLSFQLIKRVSEKGTVTYVRSNYIDWFYAQFKSYETYMEERSGELESNFTRMSEGDFTYFVKATGDQRKLSDAERRAVLSATKKAIGAEATAARTALFAAKK